MTKKNGKTVSSSQQGCVVWQGMTLGAFFKLLGMKPKLHWSCIHRLVSTGLLSIHNSTWKTIEAGFYGRAINQAEVKEPLFVLGHWRSGTTLLHNLMSLDPRYAFPNLYQTWFPHHFLMTETVTTALTGWIVPKSRPMDNMKTGWDMPQEDELALLLDSLISPYLMLAFQQNPEVYEKFFDFEDCDPKTRDQWKASLLHLMQKLTVRHKKPLIMKSPSHTFRVKILLEMFPDAKFVYIHRHPVNVMRSTLHLRRTLFTANGFDIYREENMEQQAVDTYDNCIESYESNKHLIPEGQLAEMRFEDLEQDPLGEMRQVYETLNLGGFEPVEAKITEMLPSLKKYKKNQFDKDPEFRIRIENRVPHIFERYGYECLGESQAPSAAGAHKDVA